VIRARDPPYVDRRDPLSPMTVRRRNFGVRKVCGCGRSRWPKCRHGWHFSYKPHSARRIGLVEGLTVSSRWRAGC